MVDKKCITKEKNSMNKNIQILQFLVSILYSVQSHFSGAQTIQLNGNGIPESITRSITGVDGNAA
ncbi:hypothetical protein, partial [Escherichia coli]|uniref:hypothetical protein n=1 Tax=Escherichia coli TaxID=562 RepID=UPI001CC1672E